MTQRWKRTLRTLNDVPAPVERIRERASAWPSRDDGPGEPPRRQRIVAGVVAFAVFAAVGAFAWRALDLRSASNVVDDPAGDLPTPPGADVQEFPIGQGAGRLAFAFGTIWVAEPTGVIRVDPATGEVVASIEVPGITPAGTDLLFSEYGGTDQGSSIAPAAGLVWVTAEPKIVGIDPVTNTLVTSVTESSSIVNITAAGDLLLVGGMAEGNGDLRLIDPSANSNIYVESRSAFLDAFPQVLATAHWYWAASGTAEQPPAASRWSTDFKVAQSLDVPAIRSIAEAGGKVWLTGDTSLYRLDTDAVQGPQKDVMGTIEPEMSLALEGPSIVAGDASTLWLLETTGSTSRLIELDPQTGEAASAPTSVPHGGPAEMIAVGGQPWITFRDEGLLVTIAPVG